jgi:hypothetical protein
LTKLLSSCISLALGWIAPIDHKLHEFDEVGIRTVHNGDATGGDLRIDSGEVAKENIIEHEESVLMDPIPRGVEMASFEGVENGLDAIDVSVAMFATNVVQSDLKLR